MRKFSQDFIFLSLVFLLCLNGFLWQAIFHWQENLRVDFLDVGQGDAIFIETPQHHQILIDGGSNEGILQKLAKEMPFWDRTIDLVILTHPEKDHLEGLLYVLKKYQVENILWTGIKRKTMVYKKWVNLLRKEKAKVVIGKAPEEIVAGEVLIDILYPLTSLEGKEFKDSNDTSVVSRLNFGETSFLFTGDATTKTEKELIQKKAFLLRADVLKVGHHGSKTSSSGDFLAKVSPSLAVISVGKDNKYGHPAKEVLQRLESFGIKVLRTDKAGDVRVVSDGERLKIIAQRSGN
ncbi:MBL fold metallo-hydrolase [bacterium]|nr:MBL fold metallo-hydrolase [bacterium]